jgi:uncharacterized protein YoxC
MVWVLVSVGAVTAVILLILVVALLRHLRELAGSLEALQADLVPMLEEIQRGSEEAQRRLDRMEQRSAALRGGLG